MAMDTEAAFAVIQRALEAFNADIGKARTQQAQSEETIASVEYELDQLRKLIAENALPSDRTPATMPSDVEVLGEHVGSGPQRRVVRAA